MFALLLLACATNAPVDDTATTCDDTDGTLRVCVWMEEGDEAPLAAETAWVGTDDSGADAIEALTGDDGCVDYTLAAGTWWAWGEDESANCRSWPTEVVVEACETTTLDTYLYMGCMDG